MQSAQLIPMNLFVTLVIRPLVKGVRSTDINILEEFDLLLITLSFDLAQNPESD